MANCCTPDFNEMDFYGEDFDTLRGNQFRFRDFMFSRLPLYFKVNDTYKNSEGKGLLERYLSAFGYELDFEIIPKLECYLEIIDASIAEPQYLNHISDVLGNPPDIFQDENIYRNLLRYILSVYKIKGTKKAYELFFQILGFNVLIEEIPPTQEEYNYDIAGEYDKGDIDSVYDQDLCQPCSLYRVIFTPINDSSASLTPELLSKLNDVIAFNEPINAKLDNLLYSVRFDDFISINAEEDKDYILEELPLYDTESEHDEDDLYDIISTVGQEVLLTQSIISVNNSTPNDLEGIYIIGISIIDNFNPETIDANNTQISIEAKDTQLQTIYQQNGTLISIYPESGNILATLVQPEHTILGVSTIRVSGLIALTDGKVANIDNNINIHGNTAITLIFT